MLLSRVADALYWIGRYLERAENTARVIEVAVDVGLGCASTPDGSALERFCEGVGVPVSGSSGPLTLADAALFDVANEFSVAASVNAARENARQVREEISSEMWQQVNGLFLRLKQMRDDDLWAGRTHYASRTIIEGIHLFQGITDTTMGHGEGWQYLQAGRFLERARATGALLDTFLGGASEPAGMPPPPDQAEWVALLRACSALEAYCRCYTADVRAERVTEFLLLNAEFPRSVRFAATHVEHAVRSAARYSGRSAGARAERLAGRLRASLDYGQVDEILSEDQHAYFAGIDRQCAQIHSALYQSFVTYPIESELPAQSAGT